MWTLENAFGGWSAPFSVFLIKCTPNIFIAGCLAWSGIESWWHSRPVFSDRSVLREFSRCAKVKNQRVPVTPICDGSASRIRFICHPDLPLNDVLLDNGRPSLSQVTRRPVSVRFVHSSIKTSPRPLSAAQLDQKITFEPTITSGQYCKLHKCQEQSSLW